jgi:hypothetical protein
MKYNYFTQLKQAFKTIWFLVFVFVLLVLFIWFGSGLLFASGLKEGFTWSDDLKKRFVEFQQTENDNRNQYNMDVIQQQASPKEVEELLATGFWPWSDDTRYQYMDSVWHNKIIKVNIGDAMEYAQKTYNEAAAKRLLAWNAKEGQFLLFGAKGNTDNDMIKCSPDDNNNSVMQKIIKTEVSVNPKVVDIDNANIPNEMPGFSFVKEPCNPCVALHDDYSCPFKLNIKGEDDTVSHFWRKLWRLE